MPIHAPNIVFFRELESQIRYSINATHNMHFLARKHVV